MYGIPNIEESYCRRNSEFVYLLFDWLLLDAEEKQVEIPGISPKQLREMIKSCAEELDSAASPRYIHTDTWDGKMPHPCIPDLAAARHGRGAGIPGVRGSAYV